MLRREGSAETRVFQVKVLTPEPEALFRSSSCCMSEDYMKQNSPKQSKGPKASKTERLPAGSLRLQKPQHGAAGV